ncbi:antibiotic biosynthesis monooxygenase [Streptacidiphilus pinicola]|uniref:Antibiotic biosynthesis monooxygenase n=1 Tax=Streptacidiphilus pinicola TaxID=2219663 RepID=A0A2X0IEX3_9ACTN|nr:antibiotic biosynthesis monooxygenase [Streptacidiphilus pinicola]RAG83582.1 antibiotic biosynthesis monooxygenase [Streptacidiphilus pinicola]
MSERANRSTDRASADGSGGATVVMSQKIRPGHEGDYQRWQEKTNQVARTFDGFEGTELYPPGPGEENEWVAVFRFSRIDQLTAWLNSSTRQNLLGEGGALFEEAPKQEVLSGGKKTRDAVSAVISHDVRIGREKEFVQWEEKITEAQREFAGFMGSELFRPVEGIQENWVVVSRFDTRDHLDDWLDSELRGKLLEEGRQYFSAYEVRKVGSAFSAWFTFGEETPEGVPPNWKQAMTVLLALYPTVMVLNLTVGRVLTSEGVVGYLALFIGNVLSVSILTWLLMPLVNKALAFWLEPKRSQSVRGQVAGAAVVVLGYVALIAVFGLTAG